MNTPFVFETDNEGSDFEMESPYGYETDFEEDEFEDEVRDHRRPAVGQMGGRPPVGPARAPARPAFRGPAIRPPVRPSFQPRRHGASFRPTVRAPYRPVPSKYRYPYRPSVSAARPIWGTGYRRPYDPRFRNRIGTPFAIRPGYYRPGYGRLYLDGVNRFYPPSADLGPAEGDGLQPRQPEALIRLIQSLLNKLAGSNIPVSGVMNGATLDAISQVAPEESQSQAPEPARAPPSVPDAPALPPEPAPAPAGEAEYYLNDYEMDNQFEAFDNELESSNEEEELTPEDISQLQMALSQVMGTQDEPDGRINFRTRRALRSFQQQSGIPSHGFMDRMTRRRLMFGRSGQRQRYGRRRRYGSYETEADLETELQQEVTSGPTLAARCAKRDIAIGTNLEAFKDQLKKWIAGCVTSRTINPRTGRPWRRENVLINDPETLKSINAIFRYATEGPVSMRLDGLTTVTAHFEFGRLSNGQWWVRRVGFSIWGRIDWRPRPEPPIVFKGIPVFEITDRRIATFPDDLRKGKALLNSIKDTVHQEARKDAKLMDNPISPKDLIPDSLGMPWMELAKAVAGSWLQSVINNQAGGVAHVRRQAYAFFIAGFLESLLADQVPAPLPTNKFNRRYFQMGQSIGRRYTDEQKYQIQLALLDYNRINPPSQWGIRLQETWVFPDDYKRRHSPEMLAMSLYNQLSRIKYSVD